MKTREQMLNQIDTNFVMLYTSQIAELKSKLADSEKGREALSQKVKESEKKIKALEKDTSKTKAQALTQDKGTQINVMITSNRPKLSINPFNVYIGDVVSPFNFSKNSTSSIISMVLCAKILSDLESFSRRRNEKSIVEVTSQWFLVQYGSKAIAQVFLRNFVQSVEEYCLAGKRF